MRHGIQLEVTSRGKKKKQHFSLRRFPVSEHLGASLCVGPPRRHPGPGGLQLFPCCGSSLCDFVFALAKVEAAAPAPHLHPAPPANTHPERPTFSAFLATQKNHRGSFCVPCRCLSYGGYSAGDNPPTRPSLTILPPPVTGLDPHESDQSLLSVTSFLWERTGGTLQTRRWNLEKVRSGSGRRTQHDAAETVWYWIITTNNDNCDSLPQIGTFS